MAELKTKATGASVERFLDSIADEGMRRDCRAIAHIMRTATKSEPKMWGTGIVGFGRYRYRYASGREGEWMLTAFAPRRDNITLYLAPWFHGADELMDGLGPHKRGKGCVYIKRLSDVHVPTLRKLVQGSVRHLRTTFGSGKNSR